MDDRDVYRLLAKKFFKDVAFYVDATPTCFLILSFLWEKRQLIYTGFKGLVCVLVFCSQFLNTFNDVVMSFLFRRLLIKLVGRNRYILEGVNLDAAFVVEVFDVLAGCGDALPDATALKAARNFVFVLINIQVQYHFSHITINAFIW